MRNWWIQRHSIKEKLTALTVGAISIALLVCCATFVVHDTITLRSLIANQFIALGTVLASNSSTALSFGEQTIAEDLLRSLSNRPEIHSAWFLDEEGQLFAEYAKTPDSEAVHSWISDGYWYSKDGLLDVAVPVEEAEERVGTLRLRVTLDTIHQQFFRNVVVSGVVLIVSLLTGLLLTIPLQKSITQPILDLAATAGEVSRDGDYSKRAYSTSADEISVLYNQFNSMLEQIGRASGELEEARDQLEARVEERTRMLSEANAHLTMEISAREDAMRMLRQTQGELMEASRKAGMAEFADGVLHNIGNVLNSVNISASLIAEKANQLRIGGLRDSIALISDQRDLADFFKNDERGKRLPGYLAKLYEKLAGEQQGILAELKLLVRNINHIKEIVRSQQSYANMGGVLVECTPTELMTDALQFVEASLTRHEIEVQKQFDEVDGFQADKARLIQILVNFIKNAKESIAASKVSHGVLKLNVEQRGERVVFQVQDNGLGIAKNKLTQIFNHGFTTKKNGHGFGLHSSANAASEMGGTLSVHSDGLGTGATFTLELPRTSERKGTARLLVANPQTNEQSKLLESAAATGCRL